MGGGRTPIGENRSKSGSTPELTRGPKATGGEYGLIHIPKGGRRSYRELRASGVTLQGVAVGCRMMGNGSLRSIGHRTKKAPPTARQKGEKTHEGNNNSKLGRKG